MMTFGHAAGDRARCEIGLRIATCMRTTDTASRVSGDEFVFVCPRVDGVGAAAQIGARLRRAISEPIDIDGTPVVTAASIHRADLAMYAAKTLERRNGRCAEALSDRGWARRPRGRRRGRGRLGATRNV